MWVCQSVLEGEKGENDSKGRKVMEMNVQRGRGEGKESKHPINDKNGETFRDVNEAQMFFFFMKCRIKNKTREKQDDTLTNYKGTKKLYAVNT